MRSVRMVLVCFLFSIISTLSITFSVLVYNEHSVDSAGNIYDNSYLYTSNITTDWMWIGSPDFAMEKENAKDFHVRLPQWIKYRKMPQKVNACIEYYAVGWPLRSFIAWREYIWPASQQTSDLWQRAFVVKDAPNSMPSVEYLVPLQPMPIGLIINTCFWTSFWIITICLFRYLRERWRHGRNHCIKCAYDLYGISELGCPECGWGRIEKLVHCA